MQFFIGNDGNDDYSHKNEEKKKVQRLVDIVDNSEFVLDGDYITIGRQKGSNIEISAPYVSRNQAELFRNGDDWYLENIGTITRTTINGTPVMRTTQLIDGDVIKIGDFAFLYEEE